MAKNKNMQDTTAGNNKTSNAKNMTNCKDSAKTGNKAQNKATNAKNSNETSSYESDCNY